MRSINETIELYVQATRSGNTKVLREILHPDAVMSGDLYNTKMISTSTERFLSAIDEKIVSESNEYDYKVLCEIHDIAVAQLNEKNFMNANFTNFFQLQQIDGQLFITSKLFTTLEEK